MFLHKFQAPAAKLDASSTIHYVIFVTKSIFVLKKKFEKKLKNLSKNVKDCSYITLDF